MANIACAIMVAISLQWHWLPAATWFWIVMCIAVSDTVKIKYDKEES